MASNHAQTVFGRGLKSPISSSSPTLHEDPRNLVDELLAEQASLTAVEKFSQFHDAGENLVRQRLYKDLIPLRAPGIGEQYAFSVDLDRCSGCKACVSACHSLNGLEEEESWRTVGMLVSYDDTPFDLSVRSMPTASIQHITTACHHCVDPGCLNGCPVLAYEKDEATGIVRHLDDQCIGCTYCVMKCPYEVPKYSKRLGIVRKCDMCANRLSIGEAPACAQACPTEAIKITLVKPEKIRAAYQDANNDFIRYNPFLQDSPNPRITLPTTQYFGTRADITQMAADHNAPHLDHAHWPLVIMLTLTQSAAGLFLLASIARLAGFETFVLPIILISLIFLAVGLGASVAHLGKPMKAWRAFLGWRTSWLSREIIAFNIFAMFAFGTGILIFLRSTFPSQTFLRVIPPYALTAGLMMAFLTGMVAVFTSAMVYVDTRRAFWSKRFVFVNFFGTTCLLGTCLSALEAALLNIDNPLNQISAASSAMVMTFLFVWRQYQIDRAYTDDSDLVHMNAKVIRDLLPWSGRLGMTLFAFSIVFGLLGLANFMGWRVCFYAIAAISTFSSEIMWRYIFFAAGSSRRMPGGIAS